MSKKSRRRRELERARLAHSTSGYPPECPVCGTLGRAYTANSSGSVLAGYFYCSNTKCDMHQPFREAHGTVVTREGSAISPKRPPTRIGGGPARPALGNWLRNSTTSQEPMGFIGSVPEGYEDPVEDVGFRPFRQDDDTFTVECTDILDGHCPESKTAPVVNIQSKMYRDWITLAQENSTEWLAYLYGKQRSDGGYDITGIYFPPQRATGSHVDVHTSFEPKRGTIGAVHSHVNMGVFWSGEDTAHSNWPVEIVVNSRGEYRCLIRHKLSCGRWAKSNAKVKLIGVTSFDTQATKLKEAFGNYQKLEKAIRGKGKVKPDKAEEKVKETTPTTPPIPPTTPTTTITKSDSPFPCSNCGRLVAGDPSTPSGLAHVHTGKYLCDPEAYDEYQRRQKRIGETIRGDDNKGDDEIVFTTDSIPSEGVEITPLTPLTAGSASSDNEGIPQTEPLPFPSIPLEEQLEQARAAGMDIGELEDISMPDPTEPPPKVGPVRRLLRRYLW